jgi:uncharacterized protein (DUF58 family)
MFRLRKRAIGLLVGAGLLFFLGVNVQAGWLFVLAALLLGTVVAGLILPLGALRGLEVGREVPARVHQGDEVLVDLAVTGPVHGTRRGLVATDELLERVDLWIGDLRAGDRLEVATSRIARRRGPQPVVPVRLSSGAPFGIAERRRRVVVDTDVLVLPRVEALGALPFIEAKATAHAAMHTEARRGQGPEYLGIREYRTGDSMRHVHWASTARTGSVMVREFELEQTRRLAIVADASLEAGEAWTPLDRVCCAAASIAMAAFAHGHGARLVTGSGGDDGVLTRVDEDELLERLARLTSGGEAFPSIVAFAAERLRGIDTAVLVFPTWRTNGPEELPSAVQEMTESVPRVVALPIVVTESEGRDVIGGPALAGLEQRLRALGTSVYPWRGGEDLATALGQGRAER